MTSDNLASSPAFATNVNPNGRPLGSRYPSGTFALGSPRVNLSRSIRKGIESVFIPPMAAMECIGLSVRDTTKSSLLSFMVLSTPFLVATWLACRAFCSHSTLLEFSCAVMSHSWPSHNGQKTRHLSFVFKGPHQYLPADPGFPRWTQWF